MYPFLGTSTLKDCRQSDGLGEEPRMKDGRLKEGSEDRMRASEQNMGRI